MGCTWNAPNGKPSDLHKKISSEIGENKAEFIMRYLNTQIMKDKFVNNNKDANGDFLYEDVKYLVEQYRHMNSLPLYNSLKTNLYSGERVFTSMASDVYQFNQLNLPVKMRVVFNQSKEDSFTNLEIEDTVVIDNGTIIAILPFPNAQNKGLKSDSDIEAMGKRLNQLI